MRGKIREKSKHMVSVIDTSSLKNAAIDFMVQSGNFTEFNALQTYYKWGIVEKDGKHYLINSEGVGSMTPLEEKSGRIGWYLKTVSEDKRTTSVGVVPCVSSIFDAESLPELNIEEEISLDEFVRSFGSRLESNFEEWNRFLN